MFRFATYIVVTCHMSELGAVPVFCRSNVLPTDHLYVVIDRRTPGKVSSFCHI